MFASDVSVSGTVAPGFEAVRQQFERDQQTLAEKNTQLCVYVGDEKVVDLWSSATNDAQFGPDSLINIFSSGKSLEAIAIASLVARGLIDYNEKIAHYWPEFAANGKDQLRVADLMRHEAGMASFQVSLDPQDLWPDRLKQNRIGRIIEEHGLRFRKGDNNQREYHAITRGWIVNELFRRVEPDGRTLGEFLRAEYSTPLAADVYVGLREQELARKSPLQPLSIARHIGHTFRPRFMGRGVRDNAFQLGGKLLPLLPRMRRGTGRGAPAPFVGMEQISSFDDPVIAQGETSSAGSNGSARGLAKLAAVMANGGELGGQRYLSEDAWQALHADPIDRNMGFESVFTQGGVAQFKAPAPGASMLTVANNRGREGFYGWMGLGGSIFQWHPEKRIGFGYVPTSLHMLDLVNVRGKAYQEKVLQALR